MASRSSAVTGAEGDEVRDLAAGGLGAAGTGRGAVAGRVAAAGTGRDAVAEAGLGAVAGVGLGPVAARVRDAVAGADGAWVAVAGAGEDEGAGTGALVAPAGVAGAGEAAGVTGAVDLRVGAAFLVTGVVLRAGPDAATAFGTTGLAGAPGAAVAFGVVVFLVTILLSSAMGEKTPHNYGARPVSG